MKTKVENPILPNKPLSNFELTGAVKQLKIPNFRAVCQRHFNNETKKN